MSNRERSNNSEKTLRWVSADGSEITKWTSSLDDIRTHLLVRRGLISESQVTAFLHPPDPTQFTAADVGIDDTALDEAVSRISKAIAQKESIVVYADYDADGITAGTIMWETLRELGAQVMPYIPHRVEEGYGLSQKGIDTIIELYNPTLIVTVDHGITGAEKVAYAQSHGIDVIVTDHHTKGATLPACTIVHTTELCGAGVSWFVSKELRRRYSSHLSARDNTNTQNKEHLALAAIGTVADLVPLIGPNRSIVKYGLSALNETERVGLLALIQEAGLPVGELAVYNISHGLAPRLNAMGRLEHAMDAMRLLCTHQEDKAMLLARKIALTNKDRQQLTVDSALHAKDIVKGRMAPGLPKLLFVADDSYNQGIIGLIAGKLVEEYYRPSIVLAKGEQISKASARSIPGFNIVEAIRSQSDLLIDMGGHPMAAGFTVETKNLAELQTRLESLAEEQLTADMMEKMLRVDSEIPLSIAAASLWELLQDFQPFGFGNYEPIFVSRSVRVLLVRSIGKENKHLKLRLGITGSHPTQAQAVDAVAFNLGAMATALQPDTMIDIAYTIDMNAWNGKTTLQLKIKDIHIRLID